MRDVSRFGRLSALTALAGAIGYSVVQGLQVLALVGWPWADRLIYAFSFVIAWPFMLALLALLFATPAQRRIWAAAGLLFATIYASYVTPLYAFQLASGIPLALKGASNPFAVDRYSVFWTYDGMGYICMGLSTLFAAFAFAPRQTLQRGFFLANGLFTAVIALIYFWPEFSIGLLLLGSPWMVTAPGAIAALALFFHRQISPGPVVPGAG